MVVQFLPAFVEAVDGQEKRLRIGDVNRHRHLERRAGFPHRVEAPVVDFHQRTLGDFFAQIQPQRLQDLQPARAVLVRAFDFIGLEPGVVGFQEPAVPGFGEREEAARVRAVVTRHAFPQPAADPSRQVDQHPDVSPVHHHQQSLRRLEKDPLLAEGNSLHGLLGETQVRVNIDDREFCPRNLRFRRVQHAARLIVAQVQPGAGAHRRLVRRGLAGTGCGQRRARRAK